MSVTINTNLSALAAQNALRSAASATQVLVERLSTGNRIINPSDDAAGLAIGTVLKTRASTLSAALISAAQGNSLLSVADGAAKNIGDILSRMKDLSVQANSGSITDAERAFLDQEYQQLVTEIDSTAGTTKFNTTKLLDGSISGAVAAGTNTFLPAGTTTFGAVQTIFTVSSALPTDGQTITINGATVTFTTDVNRLDRVYAVTDQTTTAANLAAFLNSSSDSRLSAFSYTAAAGVVSATFGGGLLGTAFSISSAAGTYTLGTAATATFATANTADGLGEGRTTMSGRVLDTVIGDITRGGIQLFTGTANAGIRNNDDFIGNITRFGGFSAQFVGADSVILSIKVGDITYTSGTIADTTPAAVATVTFTGRNADGTTTNAGAFNVVLAASNGSTVSNQTDADTYATRFNNAFDGVTFFQNRDVNSYVGGGNIITNGNITGSLLNTHIDLRLSDYSAATVGDITVTSPSGGSDSGVIKITINGKVFQTRSDVGTTLAAGSYTILTNVDDPKEFIGFNNGATAIKFSTSDEATSFQTALKTAFGLGGDSTGLVFQTGIESTDIINVKLNGLRVADLGLTGTAISDSLGAKDASAKLDSAITALNSVRANIGALQSRFNFKQSTLASSIQNTTAAASLILDADVSKESTDFAAKQVQVLAGISVLAQANQLPQNLLKLIG